MKRHIVPKNWPIPRKGTAYVLGKTSKGIPALILLRDVMGIVQDRKEAKKAVHKNDILSCGKPINSEKQSLELFDTLTLVPGKKNYRIVLSEKGKYNVEEIKEKDSKVKVAKIIGKKTLSGKKNQLNLSDGRNYLSETKCEVNDSVEIDLAKNAISKVLPLKDKAEILVIGGKHTGAVGKIEKIIPELKMVEITTKDDKFRVLIKQLMVTK